MSGGEGKPVESTSEVSAGTADSGSAAGATPGPAAKKAPAAKEIPPFQWKLVGYSRGIPLTLLKSVERSDIEAQLERYRAEGYYTELTIHPIDAKIPIPQEMLDWISQRERVEPVATAKKKASSAKSKASAKKPAAPPRTTSSKAKAKPPVKVKAKMTPKAKPQKGAKAKPKAGAKPETKKKKTSGAKKKTAKRRKAKR